MNSPTYMLDVKPEGVVDFTSTKISIKSIIKVLFELIVVLVLVMGFFLFLLRLLNDFFPEGSGMQEMISQSDAVQMASRLRHNLLVKSNSGTSRLAPSGELVATLTEMNRDVRSKRENSITWNPTNKGMALYNQDSIQTFSRSSATITFDQDNKLKLGPDTLVIIKRMEKDVLFNDKRSSLILVEGELSGSLENTNDTERHVEIITAGASAHIRTRDNINEIVKFKVSVNPDKSSTVAILQGSAEIISQGIKQKIGVDQALVIREGKTPSIPKPLPSPVKLRAPANNSVSYYRDIPDEIKFSWDNSGAEQYRLIISADPQKKKVIFDEKIDSTSFTHGNMGYGVYYWHVSGIDREGSEGKSLIQRKIRVIQDMTPPMLEVNFPNETIFSNNFIISGTSEPGAKVYINNDLVKSNQTSGYFSHEISFTAGINVILVEAADAAGNISYRSQLINIDVSSP